MTRWRTAPIDIREIGGQAMLFDEASQRIVAVNTSGAALWRRLQAGLEPVGPGATATLRRAAEETLADWAGMGLIRPLREEADPPAVQSSAFPRRRIFEVGLVPIRLDLCRELAGDAVWPYLAQFPDSVRQPQAALSVNRRLGGLNLGALPFGLWRGRQLLRRCARDEVAPLLKAVVTSVVLECGPHALALHAAAVGVGDRLLLLTGPTGAGKSTLAAALVAAGATLSADDMVLLDADGVARGAPFRNGVKSGAWDLLGGLGCDVQAWPRHRRPDGRDVRYGPLGGIVRAGRRRVDCIVSLTGAEGCEARLAPATALETLDTLLRGAAGPAGRLTEEGFAALAALLRDARCFKLGRRPLREAVAALLESAA